MRIRPFRPEDAGPLADLYARSVRELGARDYTAEQVTAWAALGPSPERIVELAGDGRTTLVAVDGDARPIAFGDLEADGHIDHLYAAPEAAGRGVAGAVYDELEALARRRGVARLHSEASEGARRFFVRRGFAVTGRRDLDVSGVRIHNYAVEKSLAE